MPPVTEVGSSAPVQPPAGGDHSGHGAGATVPNGGGQSFTNVLAQAIGQLPGSNGANTAGASHAGGHGAGAGVANGGSPPGQLPMGGSNHTGEHNLQEVALGLRAYRQQLIASNIANADTPGYKAVDIDFQEALRIAQSTASVTPLTLSTTASGHISGQAYSAQPPYPLKYHVPNQASADGNTVEMDVERAKFAENAVMYEFSLDRAKGHFMMTLDMLKNLT